MTITALATKWLSRCITGRWDWGQFGSGPDDAPTNPTVRYAIALAARKLLAPYGAVKSLQYVDQVTFVSGEGHHRTTYRYNVKLEYGNLSYEFAQDADGYVGGILINTGTVKFTYWR